MTKAATFLEQVSKRWWKGMKEDGGMLMGMVMEVLTLRNSKKVLHIFDFCFAKFLANLMLQIFNHFAPHPSHL